jgi:hypothetical protein
MFKEIIPKMVRSIGVLVGCAVIVVSCEDGIDSGEYDDSLHEEANELNGTVDGRSGVSTSDSAVNPTDSTAISDERRGTFYDTIALVDENGAIVEMWREPSSLAQREEEVAHRIDSTRLSPKKVVQFGLVIGCDHWDALWLYDNYNLTGNRLCLSRENPSEPWYEWIDLSTIPNGAGTWEGAVRSLWAGVNPTLLYACGPIGAHPKTFCYTDPEPLFYEAWERARSVPTQRIPYNTVNLNTP